MPKTYIENIKLFPDVDSYIISLDKHEDKRGQFWQIWQKNGVNVYPEQINLSFSKAGTVRGLHFQKGCPQEKFLTVISGEIIDIIVDIRKDSSTFGKFNFVYLEQGQQLLVPKNMAHGFIALTDTVLMYQCDEIRYPELERSIYMCDYELLNVNDNKLHLSMFVMNELSDNNLKMIMSEKDEIAFPYEWIK